MKITDYQKITELSPTSVFLVDGPSGTKTIFGRDLLKALNEVTASRDSIGTLDLSQLERVYKFEDDDDLLIGRDNGNVVMPASDAYYALLDAFAPVEVRRMTFRGKSLGTALTSEQKAQIKAGTFKGIFVGDYWTIGDHVWRIVDIDYWFGCGKEICTDHHVVIMPDKNLYKASMNDSDTTSGGYYSSQMRTKNLDEAKNIIYSAFGEDNILSHKEQCEHSITDGWSNGVAIITSTVDIPNELMIFGSYIMSAGSDGSNVYHRQRAPGVQFSLMNINPWFISTHTTDGLVEGYQLNNVVSATSFAAVSRYGGSGRNSASTSSGVRPVFGICG